MTFTWLCKILFEHFFKQTTYGQSLQKSSRDHVLFSAIRRGRGLTDFESRQVLAGIGVGADRTYRKNADYPAYDESLLSEIPEGIKVYRSRIFEPFFCTENSPDAKQPNQRISPRFR